MSKKMENKFKKKLRKLNYSEERNKKQKTLGILYHRKYRIMNVRVCAE